MRSIFHYIHCYLASYFFLCWFRACLLPLSMYSVQSRPYLDSKILIEELERASDALVAGLMLVSLRRHAPL